MIINAAYEGPPYGSTPALGACSSCQTRPQLGATTNTSTGATVLATLAVLAIGITLWSFRKPEKPETSTLKGRRRR